ncbi:MAG: ComF family protein [Janthinobacterium lividum]
MHLPAIFHSRFGRMLALPCCCALCGQAAKAVVCAGCRLRYFAASGDHSDGGNEQRRRCPRCAIGLFADPALAPGAASSRSIECGACQRDNPAYDASIAVCDYAAPADHLVLALKFADQLALAPWMAAMLREALLRVPAAHAVAQSGLQTTAHAALQPGSGKTTSTGAPSFPAKAAILPDVLIAVPLGQRRLAERGYNQALEIARPLGRSLGVPVLEKLTARIRETMAQTLVPPAQRAVNMRAAFMVRQASQQAVQGLHVGVVDDVMTTGTTLAEMAALLKRHGARRVTNFVFARTKLE